MDINPEIATCVYFEGDGFCNIKTADEKSFSLSSRQLLKLRNEKIGSARTTIKATLEPKGKGKEDEPAVTSFMIVVDLQADDNKFVLG